MLKLYSRAVASISSIRCCQNASSTGLLIMALSVGGMILASPPSEVRDNCSLPRILEKGINDSLIGIRRRGMTVEALSQFMLSQGPSQAIVSLEWDSIWALNKKLIDPIAPRFWAIVNEGRFV